MGNLSSGKSALVHRYLTGTYVQEESPEGRSCSQGAWGMVWVLCFKGDPKSLHLICHHHRALQPCLTFIRDFPCLPPPLT